MTLTPALLLMASFAVCGALLWLAAELAAQASARAGRAAPALHLASALAAACGLWWPANALRVAALVDPSEVPHWLLPAASALLLAALACAVGWFWLRQRRIAAAVCAVAMPAAGYLYAMFDAPGVFRLAGGDGSLGVGVLTLVVSAALVVARLGIAKNKPLSRALRAGSSIVAAAVVCIGATLSVSASEAARWVAGPEWFLVAVVAAFGGTLLLALRHARATQDLRRTAPAAGDHLTGLPSRLYFEGRLAAAAKRCIAKSTQLAVLFIDLDGFKPVNDTFGHSSGDRLLAQVGQRLKALARGSKLAARVGGDQFLLLASDVSGADAAADLARRLIETLGQPYQLRDRQVSISCSIGIAIFPQSSSPGKLIARADAAMYAAKRAGGGRHCFYAPAMDAGKKNDFDILSDLRQALVNDEFELFFQPKIDARSGKVTAAEALLRWKHPTRGLVAPGTFIPLAEGSGLIGPIGNWVIEAACRQARAWRDKGLRMRVAINLSAHQMRQDDIADRIAEALTRHRVHPSLLTCEITESAAMEDTAATQETFRRLGEMGAHVSIDDFGTGYSSLGYLRQLPAEELKIDAGFVKDLDHSADARAVIDAVVKLAHALGLKVVAEGVENLRQHKILVELGCDELQGFLFAKPMTARALLLWAMEDRNASAVFRDSLFGETRQVATVQGLRRSGAGGAAASAAHLAEEPPTLSPAA